MSMTPERLDKWSARLALVKFPEGTTASFLTCSEILQLIAAARLGLESAEKQQCSSAGHICVGECQHYIDQKQQIETLTRENGELKALCGQAHSELDKLMGDSDLPNDDSPLMKLMQTLSKFI